LGFDVFKADVLSGQAGAGFPGQRFKRSVLKAKEDYFFLPGRFQAQGVVFHKRKGGGKIRKGVQGV
jgi:hypothetical protein